MLPIQLPLTPQIHTIRLACLYDGVPLDPYDADIAPIIVSIRQFSYRTNRINPRDIESGGMIQRDSKDMIGLQLETTSLESPAPAYSDACNTRILVDSWRDSAV